MPDLIVAGILVAVWAAAAVGVWFLADRLKLNATFAAVVSVLLSPAFALLVVLLAARPVQKATLLRKREPNALRTFAKHWMKPLTLVALAAPFLFLAWQWLQVLTGINPRAMGTDFVTYTHHFLGDTAIRILLVTLAVSPVRDITGWAPIALIRRRIGLAAFFYAALHMIAYLWLDRGWDLGLLWEDMVVRTYIMLGMAALVLMVPLALTSNNSSIRKLGRQTWDRIHWLIFPLAILAVAHNLLMVKVIYGDPLTHAIILTVLLGWRVVRWVMGKLKRTEAAA